MLRYLQSSQPKNCSHRELDVTLHLNLPQQGRRQDCQRPVGANLNSGEEEADVAVQLEIA